MAEVTYSRPTIAKLLLLTERHVSKLTADGTLPKRDRGRYELVPVVQAYVRYLRARAVKGDVGDGDYSTHKARLVRAQADLAELQAAQTRGALLPRDAVLSAWQQVIGAAKAKLLNLPPKLAGQVLAAGTLPEVEDMLREAIHESLAELARSDGLPAHRGASGLVPAADVDGQRMGRPVSDAKPRKLRRARSMAHQPRRVPA